MARKFSFDNAAFHFMRTDGTRGFLPRFLLAYVLIGAVFAALNFGIQFLLFGSFNGLAEQLSDGTISFSQFGAIGLYYLVIMVGGAAFWAVFEASVQRRYVLDAGFSISFGGDELRLLLVGLLWLLFFIVIYFGMAIAIMVPVAIGTTDASLGALLSIPVVLAGFCVWTWLAIKLSAASALTIRDKKVHFFDSWGATRGRFWALFGAYLVLLIVALIVYFLVLGVVLASMFGSGLNLSDPETLALLNNPQSLGAMFFVLYLIMTLIQALFLYIWAGPAALAAKTDPRGGGMPNVAEEFA